MEKPNNLAVWLEKKCQGEGLSLRQAAARTGLSHATIAEIKNGTRATGETIRKLARGFGGDGHQGRALEDELLVLAGYRTEREGEIREPVARLLDKISQFSESQLRIMDSFADFVSEMEAK